jgi:enoyl-CoA hydratase/carnithine racemase
MTEVVLMNVQDGIAVLTLNRPERLNAWTGDMQIRYFDLLEECAARDDVRVIVLTGAGRGFCAGADMQGLRALSSGEGDAKPSVADERPVQFPMSIPKPIIAAINGACAGLGLVVALMCELRFAASDAKLTTAFVRRGLVAEHGSSWILPRLIGPARALDLLLSGRIVLGDEAANVGLVNRAFPAPTLLDESLEYARMLARECSPASMAEMKRQVYADLEQGLTEAVTEANRLMFNSFSRSDFAEGVRSFMERRSPEFQPLNATARVTP